MINYLLSRGYFGSREEFQWPFRCGEVTGPKKVAAVESWHLVDEVPMYTRKAKDLKYVLPPYSQHCPYQLLVQL